MRAIFLCSTRSVSVNSQVKSGFQITKPIFYNLTTLLNFNDSFLIRLFPFVNQAFSPKTIPNITATEVSTNCTGIL